MRRSYEGAAQSAQLTTLLGNSTANTTIYCDNLTNWPTGTGGRPFYVVVNRGKSNEEKILCSSRAGNVLTVYDDGVTNGRAADDTNITSHTSNSVIEHVFTATDADEANAHVNAVATVHGVVGSLVGTTDTQTLTNKTITGGTVNPVTLQQNGIAVVTTTDAQTLTNKTITAPISTVATNAQIASYTLVASDTSKIIEISNASATTITVPTNDSVAFPLGTTLVVLQTGAGQITIVGASGVTVNGTPGLKLRTQWSFATLIKRATNTWALGGDVTA